MPGAPGHCDNLEEGEGVQVRMKTEDQWVILDPQSLSFRFEQAAAHPCS